MNTSLIIYFIIGIVLTIIGGRILFSDKALDQVQEKGYWKKSGDFFGEGSGKFYDRYRRGGALFLLGLILFIGSMITFFL